MTDHVADPEFIGLHTMNMNNRVSRAIHPPPLLRMDQILSRPSQVNSLGCPHHRPLGLIGQINPMVTVLICLSFRNCELAYAISISVLSPIFVAYSPPFLGRTSQSS